MLKLYGRIDQIRQVNFSTRITNVTLNNDCMNLKVNNVYRLQFTVSQFGVSRMN